MFDAKHGCLGTLAVRKIDEVVANRVWVADQQAFIAQLPTGVALAPINWGLVINDITESLQKAIYKNATPEDAGKELYNTLEQRAKNNQL